MNRTRIWVPEILIRKTREIEIPEFKLEMSGVFTAELLDAKTKQVKKKTTFKNLIVDAARDAIGNGTQVRLLQSRLAVGTGSATPAVTDTALGVELARTANVTGGSIGYGASNAYAFQQTIWTFLESEANGNLTELGVFQNAAGGPMLCRQLFKDAGGVPTTFTKTNTEQLRITYERRLTIPLTDVTGVITVNGTNYNYTIRAINVAGSPFVDAWTKDNPNASGTYGMLLGLGGNSGSTVVLEDNTLNANTGDTGSAGSVNATSNTKTAYVNGNFYVENTAVFDPTVANFASGVGKFLVNPFLDTGNAFELVFQTTKIPKDNTQRMTLVWRVSF